MLITTAESEIWLPTRRSRHDAVPMFIRRATPTDHGAIFAVHAAAFARPDGTAAPEARLVEELADAGDVVAPLSLVAELDEQVAGHVACSLAHIGPHPALGLGPLGVMPGYQRRGVGSALMHAVLAAADALDQPAVVLLGDPRYYHRFGFAPAEPLGVLPTNPDWIPYFQIRLLTSWTGAHGVFRYAPAFDHV